MISLVRISQGNFDQFQEDILRVERVSFPTPWSVTAFRQETLNPVSHLWVLKLDGSFCGYICFWMIQDEVHLMNIAIHPEKRSKGLGAHVLNEMIGFGVSHGVRTVWLEVRPSNVGARRLYRKVGFEEVARRSRYYADTGEDAIVMSLCLPLQKVLPEASVPERCVRHSV